MGRKVATKVIGIYRSRPCRIAESRPLCREFLAQGCKSRYLITIEFLDSQPGGVCTMSILDETFRRNFGSGVDTKAETATIVKKD